MSHGEPRRWRDATDAPDGAGDLLRAAARSRPIDPAAQARSARRVARVAAVPVAVAGTWLWAKGLAAAAGVGIAAVTIALVVLPRVRGSSAPSHATSVARPSAVATPAAPARAATAPASAPSTASAPPSEPESSPPSSVAASGTNVAVPSSARAGRNARTFVAHAPDAGAATESAEDALERERRLFAPAQDAFNAGDMRAVLARLRVHAAEFPHGSFAADREALAVEALHRLGRDREARARGEAFLRRSPGDYQAARVRRVLSEIAR